MLATGDRIVNKINNIIVFVRFWSLWKGYRASKGGREDRASTTAKANCI